MTEDERDDIDNEAVQTLEKCKKGISTLQLHLGIYLLLISLLIQPGILDE